MIKNNFDQNSKGDSIELLCGYDTGMSQILFDENFKILQRSGYRSSTKAYYIDYGNVQDDSDITYTIKGKVKDLKAFAKTECYWLTPGDIRNMNKAQISDEIMELLARDRSINLLNLDDLNLDFFAKYPIELVPSKNIISLSTSGYSQGDYATVFYCPDDLEKAWGTVPKESDLQKTFDNLFWNAPIYATFTINDQEYSYMDFMPSEYDWDKEGFAKIVSEKSGIDYETILNFLPQYPDYI